MTLREWTFRCDSCDKNFGLLCWDYELEEQVCPACNLPVSLYIPERGKAPGLITDGIPGGVVINHLSNKPERFYSKTDIKRRANEKGFNFADDTPKPYAVKWSGKTKHAKEV